MFYINKILIKVIFKMMYMYIYTLIIILLMIFVYYISELKDYLINFKKRL